MLTSVGWRGLSLSGVKVLMLAERHIDDDQRRGDASRRCLRANLRARSVAIVGNRVVQSSPERVYSVTRLSRACACIR